MSSPFHGKKSLGEETNFNPHDGAVYVHVPETASRQIEKVSFARENVSVSRPEDRVYTSTRGTIPRGKSPGDGKFLRRLNTLPKKVTGGVLTVLAIASAGLITYIALGFF